MNPKKLKLAENRFFNLYPDGFESPEMIAIAKKHKVPQMRAFVENAFEPSAFKSYHDIFDAYVKLIGKSSLVSVFEKAKFRDVAKVMSVSEKQQMVDGIYAFLYGDAQIGFGLQLEVLERYKMAKWPLLTVLGVYAKPDFEVLVKPTTVKGILAFFEVTDFQYTSKPNYAFYENYRSLINTIKTEASQTFKGDNAAFCGFLMMAIEMQ